VNLGNCPRERKKLSMSTWRREAIFSKKTHLVYGFSVALCRLDERGVLVPGLHFVFFRKCECLCLEGKSSGLHMLERARMAHQCLALDSRCTDSLDNSVDLLQTLANIGFSCLAHPPRILPASRHDLVQAATRAVYKSARTTGDRQTSLPRA
jgi:hypothetical protein